MWPTEKSLGLASMLAGGVGSVALVLLSIFNTVQYPSFNKGFLFLFVLGIYAIMVRISINQVADSYSYQGSHCRQSSRPLNAES